MNNGRQKSIFSKSRLGLALGSGSARGWSHIGVIRALEEQGFEPDIVCGTSVGALVGAAYASGHLDLLERWVEELKWADVLGYMVRAFVGQESIQSKNQLAGIFGENIGTMLIEDLPKGFGAVATDLDTGQEVWFRKGSLLGALSPSIAYPGLLNPIFFDGRWLVDGALVNPVPVSLCRALGADIVIAVNLNGDLLGKNHDRPDSPDSIEKWIRPEREPDFWSRLIAPFMNLRDKKKDSSAEYVEENEYPPKLFEVISGAINIMQDRITRSRMAGDPPDLSITPRLSQIGHLEFHRSEEAILEGKRSVERMLPALEDILHPFR
ncbi:MAG: patatin-like phospholipase family protein [Leptospirales bacterium]